MMINMRPLLVWIATLTIANGFVWGQDLGGDAAVVSQDPYLQNSYWSTYPHSCGRCRSPRFRFFADGVLLDRSGPQAQNFLFDSTPAPVLNLTELNFPLKAGGRYGFEFFDIRGFDIEFSFLGVDEFQQTVRRSDPAGLNFVFFGESPAIPGITYDTTYGSELQSYELNMRRQVFKRLALLGGVRWFNLDEIFNVVEPAGQSFRSSTDNQLFGFQVGGDLTVWSNRYFTLSTLAKMGVYNNNLDIVATTPTMQLLVSEDNSAFATDASVDLEIPVGRFAGIRLGYQMLYMDRVALAPDQSAFYSVATGLGATAFGNPIYHGGYVGLEIRL